MEFGKTSRTQCRHVSTGCRVAGHCLQGSPRKHDFMLEELMLDGTDRALLLFAGKVLLRTCTRRHELALSGKGA